MYFQLPIFARNKKHEMKFFPRRIFIFFLAKKPKINSEFSFQIVENDMNIWRAITFCMYVVQIRYDFS